MRALLNPMVVLVAGVLLHAGLSKYLRQRKVILAYRDEVHELTNQIIELRQSQHVAGEAHGQVNWPGRVVDEFRAVHYDRLWQALNKQKEQLP